MTFIQNVYERLKVELDVNSFYVFETLAPLAEAIDAGRHRDVPKLLPLREGDKRRPLIVYAGGVSCFLEIKSVLDGLDHDGAIYGVCLSSFDRPRTSPATVEDEVTACFEELKRQGLTEGVSLIGYSFGGIFAMELARLMTRSGQCVRFLGMIDTPQSEHTWPLAVWLRIVRRRIRRRLSRIASGLRARASARGNDAAGPPVAQRKSLALQLKPILFRYWNPTWKTYPQMAPEWVEGHTPDYVRAGSQLLRMRGVYRPRPYEGPVVFYRAIGGSLNLCDPHEIWDRYLPNAEWVDVRGNHLSVIFGRNGVAIGQDLTVRLKEISAWSA
ncbi:thioesterase domain-containing protein [Roseibium sp. M-1]